MKDRNGHGLTATPKDMLAVVAAFRQSGASLKEFARERGISPGRRHYWVYEKSHKAKPGFLREKGRKDQCAAFREIKLEPGTGLLECWAAEASLPHGVKVRFSTAAGPVWIAAVVQALQRPC